jgi:hypothetical protein
MIYQSAMKAFRDNLNNTNPRSDPESYNLYVGLINLTSQVEKDISEMKTTLRQILSAVSKR